MKLMRRAFAVLRLAARRGSDNAKLLARIGESYFQYGEQKRAELVFRRVLELDADNFRASCGLAEIALHEGKLAHVIHHYQAATRAAEDEALKLWARTEADYFALLNRNEDYMDAELRRINWLHNVENGSRICLRLAISGLFVVSFGVFFDDLLAQLGLALTAGTTLFWVVLTIIGKFLISRSDVVEDGDNE
jgi:tetratricopeptide (TPR) repeat protein